MAHLRTPTLALLGALIAAAAIGALAPSSANAADEPCEAKKFTYPAVEKACKEGGRTAAKKVMKAARDKAKAGGKDYKCTSCHKGANDFTLKDNAVEDLKPWI